MSQSEVENEVVIIGAGITGLSAASKLGSRARIFEKSSEIGGLVRSHQPLKGYWFDHVLHLLHIRDEEVEHFVQDILGERLKRCFPVAWVQTDKGLCRFPIQLNLGGLDKRSAIESVRDMFQDGFNANNKKKSDDYKQYLLDLFGETLCNIFYFPYNSKQWRVPLEEMSASGQLWNIHKPDVESVLEGLVEPNVDRNTYNSYAYYPIPKEEDDLRCMGQLTAGISRHAKAINLDHELVELDAVNRTLLFSTAEGVTRVQYTTCVSTIPLTRLIKVTKDLPENISAQMKNMDHIKVISLGVCIRGPRKDGIGHWHYFSNPSIPFTRLIFMTEFDPKTAPENGWSILVETTAHQHEHVDIPSLKEKVIQSMKDVGVIQAEHEVLEVAHWFADPAYVVFRPDHDSRMEALNNFFSEHGIHLAGRYGNWEYSSMYNNIRNGFSVTDRILGKEE